MTPFTTHSGLAVPLARANVDTDVIIRMNRCASEPRERLGAWAFESLRFTPAGASDAACVFNQPVFGTASVLVAGPNFGCGSSREMAVWALQGMGLRCVIAPGFGDIFFANCFQNGLLAVRLPQDTVESLLAQAAGGRLVLDIDLSAQTIAGAREGPIDFPVDPLRKSMLLRGMDEIGMSLTYEAAIGRWQQRDRAARPWIHSPLRT